MYNLGDGLYETKNNGVVVKRHKELIDDLKNMPREQFIRSAVSVVGDGASSSVASMVVRRADVGDHGTDLRQGFL